MRYGLCILCLIGLRGIGMNDEKPEFPKPKEDESKDRVEVPEVKREKNASNLFGLL